MSEHQVTLTGFEAQARLIIDRAMANNKEWNPVRTSVLVAFRAMWSASLNAKRVGQVAAALQGVTFSEESIQETLTKLTRQKVLRSRVCNGERHYELTLGE